MTAGFKSLKSFNFLGLNSTISYTVFGRIVQGFGGIVLIYLVSNYLTTVEQGYYFTFGSLVAIQIFFELGLSSIILQFAAHENAHLDPIVGNLNNHYLSRLSSLLNFVVRVFVGLFIILFIVLIIAGFCFFYLFQNSKELVNWQYPWILLSFSTSVALLISPFLAYLEGIGNVKQIAIIRFYQQLVYLLILVFLFVNGAGLYSIGLSSLFGSISIIIGLFICDFHKILMDISKHELSSSFSYKKEIFPYQWRVALSWISGYFIFQLFNPVLFATEGAVIAGKMGLTLAVFNGISSLSMSWITTKIAIFSEYISKKRFKELNVLFNSTLIQLVIVNIILIFISHLGYFGLCFFFEKYSYRFLEYRYILSLSIVTLVNQLIFSWATYLRCFKKEPFLINSLVGGILCALSTLFLGNLYGISGIIYGYTFISVFIGLPWAYFIFKEKKSFWQSI